MFEECAAPSCDEDGLKFLRWGADAYVADLTDLACSSKLAWKGERCQGLKINIDQSPALNTSERVPQSVLMPMFRIVTSFADWERRGPPKLRKFE